MSMTNGDAATNNLTDKATYERLEKDVNGREKRLSQP